MIRLFHVGFQIIPKPDIRIGRRNADFGQGFYLSEDQEFSRRWARERKGTSVWMNIYDLDPEGLKIKEFSREPEWFDFIFSNRTGRPDSCSEYDLITGPIANDTIYDTWGILTSGLLDRDTALRLLMLGPEYRQTAVKTDRAATALRFREAVEISPEEIALYRRTAEKEEKEFQSRFAALLEKLTETDN